MMLSRVLGNGTREWYTPDDAVTLEQVTGHDAGHHLWYLPLRATYNDDDAVFIQGESYGDPACLPDGLDYHPRPCQKGILLTLNQLKIIVADLEKQR